MATLTGCITTFSELDGMLRSMHVEEGPKAWDRAKWFLKKHRVRLLTQRHQNDEVTYAMVLNILQWYVVAARGSGSLTWVVYAHTRMHTRLLRIEIALPQTQLSVTWSAYAIRSTKCYEPM
ncbi:hypothetical protein DOTSEDRAFT_69228 [Dothistroma septosporum NZE10]|uniref:Uncharacterized protein n=1 Tax=Dothistroma septosporum (strain NZE10 / CBS 128990) TaxID=675120 RepID=N1PW67_DOTSN|nr:hypothetical protein DOTSEDRAFT_69228 [Dothistroma septosporum NZE10]